jgi:hypothetical protein
VKFVLNKKAEIMKKDITKLEEFKNIEPYLINIIAINSSDDSEIEDEDEDLMDYDFDYDPNEMYYALLNDK